jgi:tetratricopeptide (TPR) repeat protein
MEFRFTVSRLRDGVALTIAETEKVLLDDLEESRGTSKQALWDLAVLYSKTGRQTLAVDCISRLYPLASDDEERAGCGLAMGQLQEQLGAFEAAAHHYGVALKFESAVPDTRYWLNNNLGYSLLQLSRADDAIPYLEIAVATDRDRPNAYKNLGLAHAHLGAFARAAAYFVSATQANATDARSLRHLEEMIAAHPEVLAEVPDLRQQVVDCRGAVELAASQQPDFEAHWKKMRDRPPN